MSKIAKGTIAMLLVILLALAMLAGCGSANDSKATTQSTGTAAGAQTATTAEIKTEPVKLVMWQQSWAKPMGDPSNDRVKKAIDEQLNIDLQVVVAPPENAQEKLNLMLASGDQLDIIIGMMDDFAKGYKDGMVAPLNELIDQYGQDIKKVVPDDMWSICSVDDGSIVEIPNVTPGDQNYFTVRNDLLMKYGMETPKTLDEFEAYLKKANEDTGMVPLYFATSGEKSQGIYKAFGGMFLADGYPKSEVGYDENGRLVDIIRVPGFKDIITKLADWYNKDYIAKDLISWTEDKKKTMFGQGKVASIIGWASEGIGPYSSGYFKDHEDAYFVYCDPLVGPKGTNAGSQELGYSPGNWIPSNSKVKETAMKYMNWLLADADNYMLAAYGVKGVDWDWTDKGTLSYKTIKNDLPAYGCSFYYFDYYGQLIRSSTPTPDLVLYYNMFNQYPIHEKLVPQNRFKATAYGLFSDVNKNNNSAELSDFKKEQLVKFILGETPMSGWDNFVQEYLKRGGQALDDAKDKVWNEKKDILGGN